MRLCKRVLTLAETKRHRTGKKQLGQFMTPLALSQKLTSLLLLTDKSKILEPSMGEGSFLIAIIERLLTCGSGTRQEKLQRIFTEQLYGVELDDDLYERALAVLAAKYGTLPKGHHLHKNDFFLQPYQTAYFDFIIGNPPFGGTFNPVVEDQLDKQYGSWRGYKVKKETYSFFMARSLDLLKPTGTLLFISSDTFMTISTMKGLRRRLMDQCSNDIEPLKNFSTETKYPMVVLTAIKGISCNSLVVDGRQITYDDIALTDNLSWSITPELIQYFRGPKLADYIVCSSGMTVGKNEYFVRPLEADSTFYEPYDFSFYDKQITLIEELDKARLGKISLPKQASIKQKEVDGQTYRALSVTPKVEAVKLSYPHKNYLPYNKATNQLVFAKPRHIIFWKDDGDAVLTYKKTGNWYLRGVGGQPYFLREGLTWQLIASRLNMKYLQAGSILDSGAPCAFLKTNVDKSELWFILGWTLTNLATHILKTTINHTKNIQGKDVERLPYPWWIADSTKTEIINCVQKLLSAAKKGQIVTRQHPLMVQLNQLFTTQNELPDFTLSSQVEPRQVSLPLLENLPA
jgi:tRNA1(Val) A37 N6-methylase TrmN6